MIRRGFAAASLVAVLAGVPAVLMSLVGLPRIPSFDVPGGLSADYLPLDPILETLALVGWMLWGYLLVVVALRVVVLVAMSLRPGEMRRLLWTSDALTPSVLRHLVDFAVGGAILAASFSMGRALAAQQSVAVSVAATPIDREASPGEQTTTQPQQRRYTVRPGDSLWRIADRELESGLRWPEIEALNRGRTFPDGRRLEDPRLIHPGWKLRLPSEDIQPPISKAQSPEVRAQRHREPAPKRRSDKVGLRIVPEVREPNASATSPPQVHVPVPQPLTQPTVKLPSGLLLASSFACGVLSAELVGRLRRRRLRPALAPPDALEEDMLDSSLLRDLRYAGATPSSSRFDAGLDEVCEAWRRGTSKGWPRFLAAVESACRLDLLLDGNEELPARSGGTVSPLVSFESAGDLIRAHVEGPFRAHRVFSSPLERGLSVPVGHARSDVVHVGLLGCGVTSIQGSRVADFLRHLLLSEATGSAEDLQIALVGTSRETLEVPLPCVVHEAPSWSEEATGLLRDLQLELIRRARLFQSENVEDIWCHLRDHSDERLPAIVVVVTEPPAALRGSVESIAVQATGLGVAIVALGWEPQGTRLSMHVDAHELTVRSDYPMPTRLRPFLLDAATAREAASVLARSHEPASPLPTEQAARSAEDAGLAAAVVPLPSGDAPEPVQRATSEEPSPSIGESVARVLVLGSYSVARGDVPIEKEWRTKSRELLAYLVAHPDGAPKERIIEALWPDVEAARGANLFDIAATWLRNQVRTKEATRYVVKVGGVFRLEPGVWSCDLWDFDRLIADAEHVTDSNTVIGMLREALSLYQGEFCADSYYAWAEPVREHYRTLLVRACARLADLLAEGEEPVGAVAVLDRAIEVDPFCEDIWRRAMRIEASRGERAASLRRYERLKAVLADALEVEPDPETQRLAQEVARSSVPREVMSVTSDAV